ncbi:maleylpyruvate isomerase N-terminal domain-containing protein [Kribbella sp. NPDC004536]|uniref:maleylpyruvate isomerase N-terminal domain-containing protein n=1 Tax=Kribbella sp. NPDC004536 TaxID=3364106 RepID=UPI0036A8A7B6
MRQIHEQLVAAVREAERLARAVDPDQLGDPTPCPDYDVRRLIAHLMQEIVLHSWDLAVATGQTPEFPDEVPDTVLRWLDSGGEDLSSGQWYAAPVATAADSSLDRAVARSGRDPELLRERRR